VPATPVPAVLPELAPGEPQAESTAPGFAAEQARAQVPVPLAQE